MKKILLLLLTITLFACSEEPKDYVTFSGTIKNKKSDTVKIMKRGYTKAIAVNEDGSFSDTLKVDPGMYRFYDGNESTNLFLKNGYDLTLSIDTNEFDESITYTGIGADDNNFLAKKSLLEEKLLAQDFAGLDKEALSSTMTSVKNEISTYIDSAKGIDSLLVATSKEDVNNLIKSYYGYYESLLALREALPEGSPSPTFEDYENYEGGTTSLEDLKGKYVYIDVWATWCGPCKAEIPSLKKIEEAYHDKNIAFVSMSIDDAKSHKGSWEQANKDWRAMVADKQLGGIQIMAPKGWQSQFIKDYKIDGIPRFILIDPEGKIVDASAPRPSNPRLKEVFDKLI